MITSQPPSTGFDCSKGCKRGGGTGPGGASRAGKSFSKAYIDVRLDAG